MPGQFLPTPVIVLAVIAVIVAVFVGVAVNSANEDDQRIRDTLCEAYPDASDC